MPISFSRGVNTDDIQSKLDVDPQITNQLHSEFNKVSLNYDEHTLNYQYLMHFASHLSHLYSKTKNKNFFYLFRPINKKTPFHSKVNIFEHFFIIYYPINLDSHQQMIEIAHELGHVLLQFFSMHNTNNNLNPEVKNAVSKFAELVRACPKLRLWPVYCVGSITLNAHVQRSTLRFKNMLPPCLRTKSTNLGQALVKKSAHNRTTPEYKRLQYIVEKHASLIAWLILCDQSMYYNKKCKKLPKVNFLKLLDDCCLIKNSRAIAQMGENNS